MGRLLFLVGICFSFAEYKPSGQKVVLVDEMKCPFLSDQNARVVPEHRPKSFAGDKGRFKYQEFSCGQGTQFRVAFVK